MKDRFFTKQEFDDFFHHHYYEGAPDFDKSDIKIDTGYSYENNRKELKKIHDEELKIRSALAKFNSVTKAIGLDLTIAV